MSNMFGRFFSQKRGDVRKQRKAIGDFLKGGPAPVSKIAEATQYDTDLVVWNLLGMLRWGEVEVTGEENDEMVYTLKEV
ncbi:MAG: hypothetical protein EAX87_00685 [Candidatus Thorarchaeota archaeon]|nr:hypothetical protein [Candidatus Thorarchaeota archaeon]